MSHKVDREEYEKDNITYTRVTNLSTDNNLTKYFIRKYFKKVDRFITLPSTKEEFNKNKI